MQVKPDFQFKDKLQILYRELLSLSLSPLIVYLKRLYIYGSVFAIFDSMLTYFVTSCLHFCTLSSF